MTQGAKCGLFDLPTEIRVQIYTEVFAQSETHLLHSNCTSLLRTCRFLNIDAYPVLLSTTKNLALPITTRFRVGTKAHPNAFTGWTTTEEQKPIYPESYSKLIAQLPNLETISVCFLDAPQISAAKKFWNEVHAVGQILMGRPFNYQHEYWKGWHPIDRHPDVFRSYSHIMNEITVTPESWKMVVERQRRPDQHRTDGPA